MNRPRRHHLLPVFYLAGFTDTGLRDGQIYVFDYRRNQHYRSVPKNIANERDFYRLSEPECDPFVIERNMAQIETEFAPVLYRVVETGIFQCPEELGAILSLIAMLHARGQRARQQTSVAVQQTMLRKLKDGDVTREQWDGMVAAEARAGIDVSTLPPLEDLNGLVENDGWQPKAPEVLKVGLIPELHQAVFDALANRTWSLARAKPGSGGFVCSDTPLCWSDSPQLCARLDDPNNAVTVPLSKDLALITRTDGRTGTYEAVNHVVGWVNSRTYFFSLGKLYSPSQDFLFLRRGGNQLGRGSEYFASCG